MIPASRVDMKMTILRWEQIRVLRLMRMLLRLGLLAVAGMLFMFIKYVLAYINI